MVHETFPIMGGTYLRAIQWKLIAAHNEQCKRNHHQSLEEVARRGGLSPSEALAVIFDHAYRADIHDEMDLIGLVWEA